MKLKKLLTVCLAFVMMLTAMPVNAEISTDFSTGSYDENAWTVNNATNIVQGIQAGQNALTITTGETKPTAAAAANLYVAYGANGYPMYFEYDFSYSAGTNWQIRAGMQEGSSSDFMHALSIYDGTLNYSPQTGEFTNTGIEVTPDVVHTLRLECYTEHASGKGKTIVYLDGVKVCEYAKAQNPYNIQFLVTSANSELNIYRVARLSNHPNANYRYYCETFDDVSTIAELEERKVTASDDGWSFYNNGHTASITTHRSTTNYLKMRRTGAGTGNGSLVYAMPATESTPVDINIDFMYYGAGQNMFRFENDASEWLCKIFLQDGQLIWGDSAENYTGTVIKDWVTPYTDHTLTLSLKDGAVAILLDGEFLHLTTPFTSGFGEDVPTKLRFYNTAQAITAGAEVANRFMYAGIGIKSITTDTDLAINTLGDTKVEIDFYDSEGNPLSLIYPNKNPIDVYGKADIVNLGNSPIIGRLVLAKYLDGKLDTIELGREFSIQAKSVGESDYVSISSDETEDGVVYKLFAVEGVEKMTPLSTSRTLTQPSTIAEEMATASYRSQETWNLSRIAKTIKKAENGENIVIGAIGGSITQGDSASIAENRYANRVAAWWEEKYPGQVTLVNAGVGGTDSGLGVHRMPGQLLKYNPDFVVVDFAVNDNAYTHQDYAYETIVREILESSDNAAVMLAFFVNASSGGVNAQNYEIPIGQHYGVPMVSILDAVKAQVQAGNMTYADFLYDKLVHPNDYGHWLSAYCMTSILDMVYNDLDKYLAESYEVPKALYKDIQKYTDGIIYVSDVSGATAGSGTLGTKATVTGNDGWTTNHVDDRYTGWSKVYGTGWKATEYGQILKMTVEGKYLSLIYRDYDSSMGIVKVTVDAGTENETVKYVDAGKHSSYPVIEHQYNDIFELGTDGTHTLEIEVMYPQEVPGYEETTRTGAEFQLLGVMTSK